MTFAIDIGSRNLPAQFHELVVPVSRPAGAEPEIEINEDERPSARTTEPRNEVEESQRRNVRERPQPATPEQRHRHRRDCNHVGIFGHEEQGEPETAVFGVESCHKLRLRFRKIEWRAVRFCNTADKEKDKSDRLRERRTRRRRSSALRLCLPGSASPPASARR